MEERKTLRIAVSAESKSGLESVVSPHFGRCPHFVLVNLDGDQVGEVHEVDNPFYGNHEPGQVPGFISSLWANVMLTGGMGGRAIEFFQQYGIEGVTGAYGTVRQAVERYLGGELRGAEPCKESQEHGHGANTQEQCSVQADVPVEGEYEKDDVGRLREEAEMLRRQLEEVESRLKRMS
jgi:predicted Fe-Mo cluster-binding NifX family protein